MWTVLAHPSGPLLGVTAVLAVLGTSARPIFRYPFMWRYLEIRLRTQQSCGTPQSANPGQKTDRQASTTARESPPDPPGPAKLAARNKAGARPARRTRI
jgi:hypothetical protein